MPPNGKQKQRLNAQRSSRPKRKAQINSAAMCSAKKVKKTPAGTIRKEQKKETAGWSATGGAQLQRCFHLILTSHLTRLSVRNFSNLCRSQRKDARQGHSSRGEEFNSPLIEWHRLHVGLLPLRAGYLCARHTLLSDCFQRSDPWSRCNIKSHHPSWRLMLPT